MNILKKIRKNDRGVSVVFALVIFIIISVICVTIIHAALLNIHRVSSEVDEERAYLASTSAAKLLRDCIGDATYVIEKPYVVASPADLTDSTEPEKGKVEGISKENIKGIIKEMAFTVYNGGNNNGTATKTITITADNMPKVKGTLKMTSGYVLTAEINVVKETADSDESYPLTVHFRSAWNEFSMENRRGLLYPGGTDFDGTVKITSVSWPLDGVYITRTDNVTSP